MIRGIHRSSLKNWEGVVKKQKKEITIETWSSLFVSNYLSFFFKLVILNHLSFFKRTITDNLRHFDSITCAFAIHSTKNYFNFSTFLVG